MRKDAGKEVSELGKELLLTPMTRLRAGIKHVRPVVEEEPRRISSIEDYHKMIDERRANR